ncbi:VCBS repeat-containing protein [Flavivirga abyssicola]|uniref:VCBS repeat-containing protein n=1 Tax=Flavivirga abyssicola TaxID=3063533 RepID=UPI0026DF49B1|nr:VCBS repeat-containing protein [Flavivirga sp. MEBiC07777]WVK14992.1 VCBS repeat-containing protein [Flavivirga sp. MEBiC07777]
MKIRVLKIMTGLFFLILFFNCSKEKESISNSKIFETLNASKTGIDFSNTLTENDSLNYFTYSYLYMGGGVAIGDINNDGLKDIFFTGNQVSNKLYLNKGNLQFEDITDLAGVSGDNRWYTGVTMADINADGYLDIYCSVAGKFNPKENQLYINNQDGTFTEKASEYGLADQGNSVQATFFDYDKDGDLDVYVANYPITKFNASVYVYQQKMAQVNDVETDHLYRNDGTSFTDVTNQAGVKSFGLTLSATVGDLNNDTWPDLYISNDFASPDYMYINNQDGTFREVVKQATSHTAFYGMGVDIADFNNDGNLDIYQVDMDAKTNKRKKANMAGMNPDLFWGVVNAGFHYQYMQNCLQLNTGVFEDNNPFYSNISRLTGVSSTDWSWGPLFADFDNDGLKDLFISNGTRREVNNRDFFNNLSDDFSIDSDSTLAMSLKIPSEKIDNFIYKNKGDLKFKQANKDWGIEFKGFSNGVAYADLDNDGDLEIITNNIDDYASLFENKSSEINNYLSIQFEGTSKNKFGLGNRVFVTSNNETQMQELTLTRGFQSSVAPEIHFGLGTSNTINELKVVWTDGKIQKLNNVSSNQTIILKYSDAKGDSDPILNDSNKLFSSHVKAVFPEYKHDENNFDDFKYQVLLPHKMSTLGPALAVGDLNQDGLDDYFIGGSFNRTGSLFFQTDNGFEIQNSEAFQSDKLSEDLGALIFDADNDGDNDLYVVSGGYEFSPKSKMLQDRLYINDGNSHLTKTKNALPEMIVSGSKAYNLDFNKDGKQDVLVLGRQIPGNYPSVAKSFLLENKTEGGIVKFEDVTKKFASSFENLGMATSAIITDFNNDAWQDIIIVGEWMPIRVFQNTKHGFKEVSEAVGLTKDTTGWWWSINEGDFDNDGDMDYIVGNNGLNYKYKATENETFDIYVNDFDNDSKKDIVLSYYNEGKQYPVRGRECSSQQIPNIKEKFKNYESFSEATLVDVYEEKSLESALHYQVKSFASIYLENKGGTFIIHELPVEAQVSSINKILIDDYDNDGALDALIAGNLFMSEVETPRNDAGYGLFLKGNNSGSFQAIPSSESGLFIPGDVKDIETIAVKNKKYIIAVKNNDSLQAVKIN